MPEEKTLRELARKLLTSDVHANRVQALAGSDEQCAPIPPTEADVGRGFGNLDGGDALALGAVDGPSVNTKPPASRSTFAPGATNSAASVATGEPRQIRLNNKATILRNARRWTMTTCFSG